MHNQYQKLGLQIEKEGPAPGITETQITRPTNIQNVVFVDDANIPKVSCADPKGTKDNVTHGDNLTKPTSKDDSENELLDIITREFHALNLLASNEEALKYDRLIDQRDEIKKNMLQKLYQIIGDNLDFFVRVKHMTSQNQNKSIHWFNMLGIVNRVTGNELDAEYPQRQVNELSSADFIPSTSLHAELLSDLIPLVTRVVVDNIPAFSCFRKIAVRHIPHKYSRQMAEPSTEVRIIIRNDQNPNVSDGLDSDIFWKTFNKYFLICS